MNYFQVAMLLNYSCGSVCPIFVFTTVNVKPDALYQFIFKTYWNIIYHYVESESVCVDFCIASSRNKPFALSVPFNANKKWDQMSFLDGKKGTSFSSVFHRRINAIIKHTNSSDMTTFSMGHKSRSNRYLRIKARYTIDQPRAAADNIKKGIKIEGEEEEET